MGKKKIETYSRNWCRCILVKIQEEYKNEEISTIDGVKIDFPENWVHLRKSNTEPIIRIYTEAFLTKKQMNWQTKMIEKN